MTALLVIALLAPALGLAAAASPSMDAAPRILRAAGLVTAAAWAAVLLGGGAGVGQFDAAPLTAAAACGTGLILASVDVGIRALALVTAALSAMVLNAGLAVALTAGDVPLLLATFLVTAVLVLAASPFGEVVALAIGAAIGLILMAAGLAVLHHDTIGWRLAETSTAGVPASEGFSAAPLDAGGEGPTGRLSPPAAAALVLGAAALVVAGSIRGDGTHRLLLVAGVATALRAGPLLGTGDPLGSFGGDGTELASVAVALALAAVVAAFVCPPSAALGLLALATLAAPGDTVAAGGLLGAAAVLAAAVGRPAAAAFGVPGVVAGAAALITVGGALAAVIGAATLLTAVLLAWNLARPPAAGLWSALSGGGRHRSGEADFRDIDGDHGTVRRGGLVPCLVGVWLLAAPGTWAWVGATDLASYDEGASRAMAVALVVIVGLTLWRWAVGPSDVVADPGVQSARDPGSVVAALLSAPATRP